MLIAMTGKKRSGKDTVASMIDSRYQFERVAFAGTLKGMIHFLLSSAGLTEDEIDYYMNGDGKETELAVLQGKSARYAMQTLGTEWRNLIGTDLSTGEVVSKELWTDIVRSKVGLTENVVITDMRFVHEAVFVDDHAGVKVRVVRPGTDTGDTHASEVEMASIQEDIKIYNHGSLDQLDSAVFRLMEVVSGKRGLV
ncbi:deoxynucleotide monophosphate kinase [Mesorhizobium phage Cp1R7A-A1]|nr:deoxynucleotide monophosphate kinase [Mesorhizobium phage Cp1R7A-A1]